mmetsp:Transcript_32478/g.71298  ORF Transcript_32478/g.71298 Transcript_32478/m.71298 type:complete len:268 (+) Transcript_32478:354-1157(+)|eukprot:CAMPEP_0178517446 /NCGR_PEP_ID=MMETSP0696-20121128/25695_1 /TAXON_ID=265572 /ORGANISM="Extubocellulus spinifer, Strain CCMP396" /LENGTH=267 /DNA_ID=CAMNT_0020147877 /DNA_START=117 /DNA_END=917 /DNA_ORIENTATION=-
MDSHRREGKEPFRWGSRRHRRRRGPSGSAVGTEAAAVAALKANSKAFKYPPEGFVERVEYTLLYSMLNEPKVYPENVVKEHIAAEDFNQYLAIKDAHGQFAASASSAGNNGSNSEERVSYAQLSALLALSAEKFPPKNDSAASDSSSDNQSISEKLCKVILQCVVRYAEEHGLDRKAEIQELLGPVEKHAMKRNNKAALYQVLPFYVGYAATIVTANPLPMLAGAAMMSAGQDDMYEENKNVQSIANESEKRADIEKTGLLDETDDW